MKKGDKEMRVWGLIVVLMVVASIFGGAVSAEDVSDDLTKSVADAESFDKNNIVSATTYDPQAAVNYADTWWNGRNPNYHDYSSEGGDCANFVSQCLIAGGLDLSSGSHVDGDCGCIIRCSWLHDFLVNDLGATWETRPKGQEEPLWFVPGDPAIFRYNGQTKHAVFAVTGDATHYATCNAHSTDRYHKTIQWFFDNSNWNSCTYYHIPTDIPQPPPPPTLISPGSNSYPGPTIDTLTPWFHGTSVSSADYYGLYIRDLDADVLVFNSQVDYGPIYGTSFPLPSGILSYGTHYRWNMNSYNSAGWGDYSDRLWFTTYMVDEIPPVVEFFHVSPNSVTLGEEFTITYIVSDTGGSGLKQTELWRANDVGGIPDWEGTDNPIQITPLPGYDSYTGGFYDAPPSVGTYWYGMHVVDNEGNWGWEPDPPGPIEVEVTQPDTTPPPPPTISSSTHPNENNWYNNNDPSFTWTTPSDPSGIAGYSYTIDHSSSTTPDTSVDTTGNSKSYTNKADGTWYFHVRAKDGAENWGSADHYRVKIDTANPPPPSIASSTHPNENTWYNNNDPSFTWNTPSDTSGIAGYSYTLDHSSSTTPDTVSEGIGRSKTYSNKADGTWYFHVRAKDNAGNWGSADHYRVKIDTANPPAPTISSSTHPSENIWYANNDPSFTWTTPSDPSGIAGYSYTLDHSSSTTPDTVSEGIGRSKTYSNKADGTWYFHVRAKDNAGNWGSADHYRVKIDTANPPAPTISSSTHPNENNWYDNNDPSFTWTTPSDTSGIAGYSYTLDHSSSTTPDTSVDTTGNSKSYSNKADGTWYFHVRAKDNAGNWGSADHYRVKIDTTKPSSHVNELSPTQTTTSFTVSWTGSDTGGSGLKWYDIQYKDGSSGTWTDWKTQTTSTSATFGPNNPITVQSGHTYYFQSRAQDNAGNWETYLGGDGDTHTTISVPDTTPPTWDTTVGIQSAADTGNGGEVTVTYGTATDADSPPVKYNVYYSTSSPATGGTKLSNVGSSPYTVTGLTNGRLYYFSVRAEDSATPPNEDTNTVELTATPTLIDTTPPAAITDLATSGPTSNLITLTWTAPGDDGNTGTATSYDIRYSTSMITGANWAAATQATGEPTPSMAGTAETFTVTGLTPSTTYYFAIKTADEAPNESPLSNVVSGTTSAMPDTTPPYTSGHAPAPNTVNVPIDTNIVVHVMDDGAGVDQATIVMTVEGAVVTPVIVGSPADYTLTYDPPIDFAYNQVVDVTIDASDLASPSNIMTQDSYSFTTVADITPPTITSISPSDGATGVPVTTTISATFSEAMNTASTETAFSITPSVAGTFSWVGNTMTLTPGANLASGTTYTVTIAATATDLAGNPLVTPYAWSFTTAPSGQVLTAIRDISSQQVIIGSTFTVTVTIIANQTIYALILDEAPPTGWSVTPVQNDGATFKESEIKWLWTAGLSAGDSKTVIYNVTIPSDTTPGDYTITGNVSAYGIEPITVGGDNTITVITDWNPWDDDGIITDSEIQEAVYHWLTDTPKNGHLITDEEIQALVFLWLTG